MLLFLILTWVVSLLVYARSKSIFSLVAFGLSTSVIVFIGSQKLVSVGYILVVTVLCFLLLGVSVIIVARLSSKKGDSKVNVSILVALALVLLPLFISASLATLSTSYSKTHTVAEVPLNSSKTTVESVLGMENRAKEDIIAILTMHDDVSYQKAKYNLTYSKEVGDVYFKNDKWKSYVEFIGQPTVSFTTIGADISDLSKSSYYSVVSLNYTRHNNKRGSSTYMITTEYQNGVLVKFVKRAM
jgi:hypothetical protein